MKRRIANRPKLMRPADVLMPLGFLTASLFTHPLTLIFFLAYALGITLLSLASCRGIRIAFSTQPSIKKVCGSVKTALLTQIGAAALCCAGLQTFDANFDWSCLYWMIAAGWAVNIEHTFYEYMYATGDGSSAAMTRVLSTALFTAGLILSESNMLWLTALSALAAAISAVVGMLIGGPLKGKINAQVLRCAPRALVQTFLYPAAAAAILLIGPFYGSLAPVFPGLALYELCKTPFRRSNMESRSLHRILLIAIAVGIAAIIAGMLPVVRGILRDDVLLSGILLIVASICTFALFGNPRRTAD